MKFSDIILYAFSNFKKHKFRFFINTLVLLCLMFITFSLTSLITSLKATKNADLLTHLSDNNNLIEITLNGSTFQNEISSVSIEELSMANDILSKFKIQDITEKLVIEETYFKINNGFTAFSISPIENSFGANLLTGEDWNEKMQENFVWISEDIIKKLHAVTQEINIGSKIEIYHNNNKVELILKGIISNIDSVYVNKQFLIQSNIAYISYVNYSLDLEEDTIANFNLLENKIKVLNSQLNKDTNNTDRFTAVELLYSKDINFKITVLTFIIIAIILYFAILIFVILKNSSIINIFDNIKSFAIMRCYGLENKELVLISMVETISSISCSIFFGAIISYFSSPVIKHFANMFLNKNLIFTASSAFSFLWWLPLVYFVCLISVFFVYFSLVLAKNLNRKNLIKTLRSE